LRKLVAAITFLAVLALPAAALAQPRWHRGSRSPGHRVCREDQGGRHQLVVRQAGRHRVVAQQPHPRHLRQALPLELLLCEGLRGALDPEPGLLGHLNYDPKTNIAWYGSLHLNTRYLTNASARRKTACHELGHVLGLEHRRTGKTCMRDGFTTMYGHPDGTDFVNLRRIYARP